MELFNCSAAVTYNGLNNINHNLTWLKMVSVGWKYLKVLLSVCMRKTTYIMQGKIVAMK